MLLRPSTTWPAAEISIPIRSRSSITPDGVAEANNGSRPFIAVGDVDG